jgi:serine/threonine-protein kinase RsbT
VTNVNDDIRVPIGSGADIMIARQEGRKLAEKLGMNGTDLTVIATAISEVARNIVDYARRGEILLRTVHQGTRRGIQVEAQDQGPGIADIDRAMQDGYSTGRGLGLGLPGSKRLMDEFEIDSKPGKGTRIKMIKWLR